MIRTSDRTNGHGVAINCSTPPRLALGGSLLALLLVALIAPGCGYSMKSLTSEGVSTVAVEMVKNPTFRRDLEFQLTTDLKEAILSRTDLRIVERTQADVLISGTIIRVREQVLTEDRLDNVEESAVIVTVEFTATNQNTGEVRSTKVTDRAEFIVGRDEDLNSATAESFRDLSEQLVYNLLEKPF